MIKNTFHGLGPTVIKEIEENKVSGPTNKFFDAWVSFILLGLEMKRDSCIKSQVFNQEAFFFSYGIIWGILNASWKICFLVVNGQSFLVLDGYLLNL